MNLGGVSVHCLLVPRRARLVSGTYLREQFAPAPGYRGTEYRDWCVLCMVYGGSRRPSAGIASLNSESTQPTTAYVQYCI